MILLVVASHDEVTRNILIPPSSTTRSHLSLSSSTSVILTPQDILLTYSVYQHDPIFSSYRTFPPPLSLFLFLRPSPLTRFRYSFSTFVFFPHPSLYSSSDRKYLSGRKRREEIDGESNMPFHTVKSGLDGRKKEVI